MTSKRRAKLFTPLLARSWTVASVLACASLSVKALSLGQVYVESGLGQPLRAAVEITQYKIEDLRRLKVQLAEPASFAQAGMAFHPALSGLQTRLEFRGDGKPYIALTGTNPVNEHFIDVIVEAQWPSGRLAMNYTLLVSPAGAVKTSPENVRSDAAITAPVVSPQALAANVLPVADSSASAEVITVQAGDTASKLALPRMPQGVSLDQMLLAMVRANPEAFIESNVNLLREGAQVRMPIAEEATQVSAEEARQTVITQTVDFAAYARRLAQSALKAQNSPSREMTGKLGPAWLPTPPSQPERDQLTLSQSEVTVRSAEAQMAVEREIQNKTEQLAALKKNLETLKSLSAATNATAGSPMETPSLKPSLPVAVAELPTTSWLDRIRHSPAIGGWAAALLAGMVGLAWWARRRPNKSDNLFGVQPALTPTWTPTQPHEKVTTLSPLPSGLPPQFANLDLNLTPAPDAPAAPPAPSPQGPQT
jgi:pilus assembly protein FimV